MGLFDSIKKVVSKVADIASPIISIGSTLLGGYEAYKSGEAAEDAAKATEQSSEWQAQLAREQWQRYLDTFAPLEDQLVKEASEPLIIEKEPGFSRMMGTIDRGYSDLAANTRRTLAGRYPQGSGLETAAQNTIDLERTRTKAGAISDFATAAENARFNKMLQAANIGRGLPAQASSTMSSSAAGQSALAQMYGNAAQQGWQSVGQTAGNLMQMYLLNKYLQPSSAT